MIEAYWTLGQAHRWICWRDTRATTITGKDLRATATMAFHGVKLHTDPGDARQLLLEALRAGGIEAIDRGRPVPREVWASLQLEWSDDDNGLKILPDDGPTYRPRIGTAPPPNVPINPKIPSAAAIGAWPDVATLSARVNEPVPPGTQSTALDLALIWTLADELAKERGGEPEQRFLDILDALWAGPLRGSEIVARYYLVGKEAPTLSVWTRDMLAEYMTPTGDTPSIEGFVGRRMAFYRGLPRSHWKTERDPVTKGETEFTRNLFDRDPEGRVGLAIRRTDFERWKNAPTPRARDRHPEYLTILQHARAWLRACPNSPISSEELAADMVRQARDQAFEVRCDKPSLNFRGEAPSSFDPRDRRLTGTFSLDGEPVFSDDIASWLGSDRPSTHPANRPLGVTHELRLDPEFLRRWQETEEGQTFALQRGLVFATRPEPPTASDSVEPAEPVAAIAAVDSGDSSAPASPSPKGRRPRIVGDAELIEEALALLDKGEATTAWGAAGLVFDRAKGASPESNRKRLSSYIQTRLKERRGD